MQPLEAAGAMPASVNLCCADARRLGALVPPASVHLVITSPPYNVGAPYASHDDNLPEGEYWRLLSDVFAACAEALVNGVISRTILSQCSRSIQSHPFAGYAEPRVRARY